MGNLSRPTTVLCCSVGCLFNDSAEYGPSERERERALNESIELRLFFSFQTIVSLDSSTMMKMISVNNVNLILEF